MKMSSSGYVVAMIILSQLLHTLPSRAQLGARSSMQCQNIVSSTAVETSVAPNFGYLFISEDTNVSLDGRVNIPHKGKIPLLLTRHEDVIPGIQSLQATFTGTIRANRVEFLFAPGARTPYGIRTTPGNIPLTPITASCFPLPPTAGGGGGGGGFQCPPGTYQIGNTTTCAASTASLPYSSPNRLVASTFDRPTLQTQSADPANDLTKWEGVSWQADHADN
jgi:hypothetical protein